MDRRQKIVQAAEKALIELDKVIRQKIDLVELDPEKAKSSSSQVGCYRRFFKNN